MSSHIKALLRNRYPIDEWALAFEVTPETGGGNRRADAVAMNMWRSRGHAIHGFEFKVSRSDWLRELKDHSKADAVAQYCDYWWLVVDADHIAKEGELPEGWGLLTVTRNKADKSRKSLRVQVKAAKQNAAPLNKLFMASLFRSLGKVDDREIQVLARKEAEVIINQRTADMDRHITRARKDYLEMINKIKEIEKITGIELNDWLHKPMEFCKAVKLVQESGIFETYRGFNALSNEVSMMNEQLRNALSNFNGYIRNWGTQENV